MTSSLNSANLSERLTEVRGAGLPGYYEREREEGKLEFLLEFLWFVSGKRNFSFSSLPWGRSSKPRTRYETKVYFIILQGERPAHTVGRQEIEFLGSSWLFRLVQSSVTEAKARSGLNLYRFVVLSVCLSPVLGDRLLWVLQSSVHCGPKENLLPVHIFKMGTGVDVIITTRSVLWQTADGMGWDGGWDGGWMGLGGVEIKLSFLPKRLESAIGIERQRSNLSFDWWDFELWPASGCDSGTMRTLALWMFPLLCKFSLAGRSTFVGHAVHMFLEEKS